MPRPTAPGWMTGKKETLDMKLKLDANGVPALQDGKPVYIKDDGSEVAFDAAGTVATITRLNAEAKTHRERAESAEGKLKSFEGIADPTAAIKALEVVKNLDAKQLVDAGQVEKVRQEAIKAVEEKYAPIIKERDMLQSTLSGERLSGSFAKSKFVAEKLAIPADIAMAKFGSHFTTENGRFVGKDSAGNVIYSPTRPGEMADFDEALQVLVDGYSFRDSILKGAGGSGGGSSGKGGSGGKQTYTRAQFNQMPAAEQMAVAGKMAKGEVQVTD